MKRWETISFDDDDDDDLDDDDDDRKGAKRGLNQNTFLVVGGEGKTSLVHHLAHSLKYEVIEVNNADQTLASVVGRLQEATQSRVMKLGGKKESTSTNKKMKTKISPSKRTKEKPKRQEVGSNNNNNLKNSNI